MLLDFKSFDAHMLPVNSTSALSPIEIRNRLWRKISSIPSWVDIETVGLDQFFTRPEVAKQCFQLLLQEMESAGIETSNYNFIEPSAGLGAFYQLLPSERSIGIDVQRFNSAYVNSDFLSWKPPVDGKKYICVGNPPFGYRAWLALAFLNHAAEFSDFVGFIVPMAFQSRGKSNVQDRVKGLSLMHSSPLPADSFIDENGKPLKVNALWQIWGKVEPKEKKVDKTCDTFIDLFTVDMRKERLCGQKRIHEASFFIQRTFYTDAPSLVESFDQVKYVCGYGIVLKKEQDRVVEVLKNVDWKKYSNLASHNCRHISMYHIKAALVDNGVFDHE